MSTELKTTEQDSKHKDVHLTSFFGGADAGRCVQLTQCANGDGFQLSGATNVICMTQQQAVDTIATLTEWLKENPVAASVLADKLAVDPNS